jgi:hypothetical protein
VKYPESAEKAAEKKSKGKSWLNYPYLNAIITALLIGLKIGGVISWSWLMVTIPMWVPLATVIGVCTLVGTVIGLGASIVYMIRYLKEVIY